MEWDRDRNELHFEASEMRYGGLEQVAPEMDAAAIHMEVSSRRDNYRQTAARLRGSPYVSERGMASDHENYALILAGTLAQLRTVVDQRSEQYGDRIEEDFQAYLGSIAQG